MLTCNKQNLSHFTKWFSGRTALVTGATSGIGREIAKQLASYGCKVLLCGRDSEAMNALLKELNNIFPSSAEGFLIDISDKNNLQELIEKINRNYIIDILANNAAFGYMGDFHLMPQDKVIAMQEVNMSAVITLCRAFLPGMVKRSFGGILNVGSVASFFATPGSALYGATKGFILGFTDALHQEMISSGIHVTGVYPGHTKTNFLQHATGGRLKDWQKAIDPKIVAKLALNGLSKNKIRVITGLENRIKIFAASVIPVSLLLNKIHKKSFRYYSKQTNYAK